MIQSSRLCLRFYYPEILDMISPYMSGLGEWLCVCFHVLGTVTPLGGVLINAPGVLTCWWFWDYQPAIFKISVLNSPLPVCLLTLSTGCSSVLCFVAFCGSPCAPSISLDPSYSLLGVLLFTHLNAGLTGDSAHWLLSRTYSTHLPALLSPSPNISGCTFSLTQLSPPGPLSTCLRSKPH